MANTLNSLDWEEREKGHEQEHEHEKLREKKPPLRQRRERSKEKQENRYAILETHFLPVHGGSSNFMIF